MNCTWPDFFAIVFVLAMGAAFPLIVYLTKPEQ